MYFLSYKQTPISWKNYELNKLGLPTLKEAFLLRSQSALEFSVKIPYPVVANGTLIIP